MNLLIQTRTELKPHQIPAVEKMIPTRIGGLFMDMGTGKTRTAIEIIKIRQNKVSNIIIFCPVSVKETIRREILKHTHTEENNIYVFNDKSNSKNVPKSPWYIIGIESMSSSNRVAFIANKLINTDSFVIVDESSFIKGHRSIRTQRITLFAERAKYRLLLTGTPFSQGVVDLFAQMRFLSPKILGYSSFYSFAANHLEYSDKYRGLIVRAHNLDYLAAKIAPYIYQVKKDECLNLPEKLYDTRYFEMTYCQREYYEQTKYEILSELIETDYDKTIIFRLFTALQQITSGFLNNKNGEPIEIESDRIDVLLDIINEIPLDEKIIIWAKYNYDIEKIYKILSDKYGENTVVLFYGKIENKKRAMQEEKFQKELEAKFFIATQSCGGYGLNSLISAKYIIFYSNSFKYSERLQAEGRSHRIGQNNRPLYIDIQCSNSIDDRIADSLHKKGNALVDFRKKMSQLKDKKSKKDIMKELIKSL